ncbi:MAG: hypothetical protein JJT77_01255 [Crocinitomicaceae bacterium]|nr:hypothetical protein [Crocinitomicaceae bacterium]
MQTTLTDPTTRDAMPMLNAYQYDQLNRLLESRSYESGLSSNFWNPTTYNSAYFNKFVYDANGNSLTQQRHSTNEFDYSPTERNIYDSSRLGRNSHKVDMLSSTPNNAVAYVAGEKFYELSNHLGNVLTVISDIKYPVEDNGYVDYFEVQLVSVSDYSEFGVQLDGRTVSSGEYRYGFQGQEMDDEVEGEGNSVNYKYRMHDPRVGRFFAVEPLADEYPHYSPYSFSGNKVTNMIEREGLEEAPTTVGYKPFDVLWTAGLGTRKNIDGGGLLSGWSGFLDFGANFASGSGNASLGGHYNFSGRGNHGFGVSAIGQVPLSSGSERSYPASVHYFGESFNNVHVNDFDKSIDFGFIISFETINNQLFSEVIGHLSGKVEGVRGFGNISISDFECFKSGDFNSFNAGLSFSPNRNIGDRHITFGFTHDQNNESNTFNLDASLGGFQAMFSTEKYNFGTYTYSGSGDNLKGFKFGLSGNIGGQLNYTLGDNTPDFSITFKGTGGTSFNNKKNPTGN